MRSHPGGIGRAAIALPSWPRAPITTRTGRCSAMCDSLPGSGVLAAGGAPGGVGQIPVDGLFQPTGQIVRGAPIQLPRDAREIGGVAAVMTGTVGDEVD